MSDLVKRLRGLHHIRRDSTPLSCAIDLAQQAADEIERLTAALSAEPAQEMTDERISDLMGWNVEAMQQNEPEDLPTRVRALVRVAEAEAVAADRASRLPAPHQTVAWLQSCLRDLGGCPDGGKCHHGCVRSDPCARQTALGCVPLSGSGLADDWSYKALVRGKT